jgi:GTP-binding protein
MPTGILFLLTGTLVSRTSPNHNQAPSTRLHPQSLPDALSPPHHAETMFVDRVTIQVTGGRGGHGCMSFRREKYVPRGGPDGGDGGNGGSIILHAKEGVNSLMDFSNRHHIKGKNGKGGQGSGRHGANADDIDLYVPPGTIVIDANNGFVIKDLANDGDTVIAAHGGRGGRGNTRFKSSTNQAPRQATEGGAGEDRKLILELKVIADVGLVGMPNAGKSTLLSRISAARPEIANYPFTTRFPNLGIVQIDMDRSFVMADIPGLIEGAADGVGLGHDFLKHIERAGIIVHLVEPMPMDQTDPVANYLAIRNELEQYNASLVERPEILVCTKSELPDAAEVAKRLAEAAGRPVLSISAVTGEGLPQLLNQIDHTLTEQAKHAAAAKEADES